MRRQPWKGSSRRKHIANGPKTSRKRPVLKPVAILWTDATSHEDEQQPLPVPTPALSFGIIVEETDSHVTLAKEIFADGDMRYKTSIPRGMVHKIIPLRDLQIPLEFLKYLMEERAKGNDRAKWHEA